MPSSSRPASKTAVKKGSTPTRTPAGKAVMPPKSVGGVDTSHGGQRGATSPPRRGPSRGGSAGASTAASRARAAAAVALAGVTVRRPERAPPDAHPPTRGEASSASGRAPAAKRAALAELFRRKTADLVDRIVAAAPTSLLERALASSTDLDMVATGMEAVVVPAAKRSAEEQTRIAARAAARARGIQYMTALLERAGGAYTAEELAAVLGKEGGRATVAAGRKSDRYFGLPTSDGAFAYPKLQVTADHALLPGLQTFLQSFTLPDPWMKLTVLLEPAPALGGRAPLDALRAGDVEGARAVARAYGSHGA